MEVGCKNWICSQRGRNWSIDFTITRTSLQGYIDESKKGECLMMKKSVDDCMESNEGQNFEFGDHVECCRKIRLCKSSFFNKNNNKRISFTC